jgi:hypothetical protein
MRLSWQYWTKNDEISIFNFQQKKVLGPRLTGFLLAVESCDLSQADKILTIGSSLVKLSSLVNSLFLKFFCSLRPKLSAKWILSILSDLPLTRETETNVYFFNFTKLQFLNDKIYSFTKKTYLALGNLAKFWSILSFKNLQDWKVNFFLSISNER